MKNYNYCEKTSTSKTPHPGTAKTAKRRQREDYRSLKKRQRGTVKTVKSMDDMLAQLAADAHLGVAVISSLVFVDVRNAATWVTYLTTSSKGVGQDEFHIAQIILGGCADDPRGDKAEALRQDVAAAARRRFDCVHLCATEVEAAHLVARLWPGERSRRIEAETVADYASRAQAPSSLSDQIARAAMQWPMLPEDTPFLPGRVVHLVFRHESWCRTLNGGSGADCTCRPDITRHLQPKDL
jgi:hypothetical protein